MPYRASSFALVAVPMFLAVAGCSGSTTNATGTGATSASSTSSTGAGPATTGSSTGSSSSGDFDAGAEVQTYTTGMGPISLMPGQEETNCIVVPLGNADGGYIRRIRANLSAGSHHMIVYITTAAANPTPTPCVALSGILTGDTPLFIAQQPQAELVWPTDDSGTPVAAALAANQMVKVEFHTINTTTSPLMATGSMDIDTVALSTKVTPSDLAFWGTEKINIPPNGTFSTPGSPPNYQAALPGTKSFAVTTHQHHLGTEIKVWYSAGQGDTSTMIADDTNWANPPLTVLSPMLDFPSDGSKGLSYQCSWMNPTATAVKFGESANDEMCFIWHYYYPSQGFQFCVDGFCKTNCTTNAQCSAGTTCQSGSCK